MVERKDIVTIDGPSGAGKSTISKLLAAELHYTYLDTGAMYRVVGLQVERSGFDLEAENGREKLVQLLATLEMTMAPGEEGQETRVFLHGEDVSDAIRTPEMAMVASRVSAEPEVRKKLTEMQRAIGQNGAIVAEGRDMGTIVFPEASYKFFLDATPAERAKRRQQQLMEQGQRVEYGELLTQIQKRDRDDSSRALAPLKPAPDAVVIDSSEMSIDEVVSFMLKTVHEKKK
ncbi:MAG: (d)CMP kinase [Desulfobulbaceae bacterium]|jgi:cytidylate kinase|nr:(d)CMP kinase [Desulfobulbaceae bacterium]HKJ14732.1 (d)CMP kinase [Desulfobulbales bacterium]MDH3541625.1 (d)CMP kinase [Desulfobulbaceae bacterium]MDH3777111.1 (d)CMP kinase [Desulfobulbaceae bacterium]MDH3781324.1 (d)CMP kinase [Desulfobulbaceae bacterium]